MSLLSFKSFLLVLHLSLCFVPAYFKFDSITDSFIKWAEIDHAEEKEDWLKRKMNKAEEEEEECVKAEKIVNQESSKRRLRITASKPFWFVKYFFMLSLYLELSIWTNSFRSFLCVKDLRSNVFSHFILLLLILRLLLTSKNKFVYSQFKQSVHIWVYSCWIIRADSFVRVVLKTPLSLEHTLSCFSSDLPYNAFPFPLLDVFFIFFW